MKIKDFILYFGMSIVYNLAYFFIVGNVNNYMPMVFMIGILWSLALYKLCMYLWDIHRKMEWKEGLIVMAVQFLFQFLLLIGLNFQVKGDAILVIMQVVYGLLVLFWMPVQMGVNYYFAFQKKPNMGRLWKLCTSYLIILVGLDTLTKNAYALSSLEGLGKTLGIANNAWFGWSTIAWMQLHFQSALGLALVVILIYFVLSAVESGIWLYVVKQIGSKDGSKWFKAHK